MYLIVKQIHIILVIISVLGFQIRYFYFKVNHHSINVFHRIWPQVIDTLLLVAGISLAVMAGLNPLNANWLLIKLLLLIVYIGFGTLAMKRQNKQQWLAYLLATMSVLYMIFIAIQKSPWL